ncbi:MAG: Proline-threonine-rich repeat protein [Candidatus Gottesmanbacteria bacterium GW2011_GWA1_34_13]|uniref:Proline-threonine-rich repeat protein n=1 Tax=Candidatus Gottesmanbacteria bacterium GW2011_GWA1_34_13 TaxID=1618434 RepID=A0A0G0AS89_9BACT|nr:MAG: Proline-threonine-rich repeat protein [Candidatus Gottesmanbacteria bacterium GW2011_GWA1_34_13]
MDADFGVPQKGHKMLVVTIILIVILLVLVLGASLLQKPKLVSPLAEDSNSVRVIFVSPEASASVSAQPSVSVSATPKSSPKATPKSTPKASSSASPSATPR